MSHDSPFSTTEKIKRGKNVHVNGRSHIETEELKKRDLLWISLNHDFAI